MVTIQAGEGESAETWFVHRELLCSKSDFFKTCLESGMSESVDNKVVLKEDDPKVVAEFVSWLYTGKFRIDLDGILGSFHPMYNLYFFADKIGSDNLCNQVVDAIRNGCKLYKALPACDIVADWCKNGQAELELTAFAVDSWAYEMVTSPEQWRTEGPLVRENITKHWSTELLVVNKLLSALWKFNQNKDIKESPSELRGCHYHRHKEGAKCSKAS
jgi:hypothetical protein